MSSGALKERNEKMNLYIITLRDERGEPFVVQMWGECFAEALSKIGLDPRWTVAEFYKVEGVKR